MNSCGGILSKSSWYEAAENPGRGGILHMRYRLWYAEHGENAHVPAAVLDAPRTKAPLNKPGNLDWRQHVGGAIEHHLPEYACGSPYTQNPVAYPLHAPALHHDDSFGIAYSPNGQLYAYHAKKQPVASKQQFSMRTHENIPKLWQAPPLR